ncbi:acyl carrier protein, partial [Streptosporangium sp. NPDC048865]|uniref:acyl carrier protein n=1 Tax=Streptosporangium sp. NPDC048865 TaxID=3155766 RepID=UPI0034303C16
HRALHRQARPVRRPDHAETLGVGAAEFHRSFLEVGGDSMGAVHLVNRIQDTVGLDVPVTLLLDAGTLRELVEKIVRLREAPSGNAALDDLLVEIEGGG